MDLANFVVPVQISEKISISTSPYLVFFDEHILKTLPVQMNGAVGIPKEMMGCKIACEHHMEHKNPASRVFMLIVILWKYLTKNSLNMV
jgi:hypothetical protein